MTAVKTNDVSTGMNDGSLENELIEQCVLRVRRVGKRERN